MEPFEYYSVNTSKENSLVIFFQEIVQVYGGKCSQYNTVTYWVKKKIQMWILVGGG